jgi:hypothetical protein
MRGMPLSTFVTWVQQLVSESAEIVAYGFEHLVDLMRPSFRRRAAVRHRAAARRAQDR